MLVLDEVRQGQMEQVRALLSKQFGPSVQDVDRQVPGILRWRGPSDPPLNIADAVLGLSAVACKL